MSAFLVRVVADLRQHKNLELYLTLIVGGIVLIVDLFDLASPENLVAPSIVFNTVLAVLLLLAFGMLGERHHMEEFSAQLKRLEKGLPAKSFFSTWNNAIFQNLMATAKTLSVIAVAPDVFLRTNEQAFMTMLARGGRIEIILIRRDGEAARMESERSPGTIGIGEPEFLQKQIDLAVQTLREYVAAPGHSGMITLKLVDQLPPAVVTIVDRNEPSARAFITLQGFKQPFGARPHFVLSKADDEPWFSFYSRSFDELWNWSGCDTVPLTDEAPRGTANIPTHI